jgi:hypothetical protein
LIPAFFLRLLFWGSLGVIYVTAVPPQVLLIAKTFPSFRDIIILFPSSRDSLLPAAVDDGESDCHLQISLLSLVRIPFAFEISEFFDNGVYLLLPLSFQQPYKPM